MPMAGYMYVWLPYVFYRDGSLFDYFTHAEVSEVQGLNLAVVSALTIGAIIGGRSLRRDPRRTDRYTALSPPRWKKQLFKMSVVLGGTGLLLYVYGLTNVGGFVEAYNDPKGGGWASSGYLRDFTQLTVPSLILLFMYQAERSWTLRHRLYVGLLLLPLAVHGILSARRGPTFIGLSALAGSYYLTSNRRPSLPRVLLGGAMVGILLLVLVTYRGEIHIGSRFLMGEGPGVSTVITESTEVDTDAAYGNTYVYGTYTVLLAQEREEYYWGRRVLATIFVRPIPSSIWPTKYEDMGVEAMLYNAGTLGSQGDNPIYDRLAPGAAPGLAGDLFVEFWWGCVFVSMFIGWVYGTFWRKHLVHGGLYTVIYGCLISFSLFLMAQTLLASLTRMLVVSLPTVALWMALRSRFVPRRLRTAAMS